MIKSKGKSGQGKTSGYAAARPVALVTGASMGIGQELARQLAAAGHDLILVARSADKLEAVAQAIQAQHDGKVWVEPADLAQAGAAGRLHATLQRKRVNVQVLVNCAGVLQQNAFLKIPADQQQQMIDLNITGLSSMLAQFLPGMVARGSGRVLNVASIAAFQPIPGLATYAATKAYVLSLTESLAEELRGTGVTVTALCPGITATPMLQSAASANSTLNQIPGFLVGAVDDVARQGLQALQRGDVICVPGALNRLGTLASRSTPKWLVRRLGGLLGKQLTK